MDERFLSLFVGFLLLLTGCEAKNAQFPTQIDRPNATTVEEYWFDGAEITTFKLTQSRYGQQHEGHAVQIFVTENFLTDKQVKHEFGDATSAVPVLKLNAIRRFNTGFYDYSTMKSTFYPIGGEHSLKTTLSIQDWCGQAYSQVNYRKNAWEFQWFSYFQAIGDAHSSITDAHLEDDIWLKIRLDPKSLPMGEFKMIPSKITHRFLHIPFKAMDAIGTIEQRDNYYRAYKITYPEIGRYIEIEYHYQFPYYIMGWEERDKAGQPITKAERMHTEMRYYWSENKNKHAPLRENFGLEQVMD